MTTSSFVDQLYSKFLGRAADHAGKAYWSGLLDSGSNNAAQVTELFLNSPEFADIVQPVARLYFAAFARIPDAAGLGYWIGQAQGGMSLVQIGALFVSSAELTASYGNLDDGAFLELLYQNALGRRADSAGKAYWLEQITQHGTSRAEVLGSFANSSELVASKSAAIKVIAEYHGTTGTAPTQAQIDLAIVQNNPLALITELYASKLYGGAAVPQLNASGVLVDGYIEGATVFIDTNANGALDAGEFSTMTDAHGNYAFASHAGFGGTLVSHGGVDISTGKAVTTAYSAPAGSSVINPLTTLVQQVASATHLSAADAQALVKARLGIAAAIDLQHTDPVAASVQAGASASEQAQGLKLQLTAVQVATLVTQSSALLRGAGIGLDAPQADAAAMKAVAAFLADPSKQGAVELVDSGAIEAVIKSAAGLLGASPLELALIAAVAPDAATVITQINSTLAAAANGDPLLALSRLALIQANAFTVAGNLLQGVSLGSLADALHNSSATALVQASASGGGSAAITVLDTIAPTLLGSVVASSGAITLEFSESVRAGSGMITISDGASQTIIDPDGSFHLRLVGATDTRTIPVATAGVTFNGTHVTITPAAPLKPGLAYSLTMAPGVLVDASGNPYAGLADATMLHFTGTTPPDTTAPIVTGSTPGDNATAIATSAPIAITFSETVHAGSGYITITNGSDIRVIQASDTSQVSFGGTTMVITPATPLAPNSHYSVLVDAVAVRDTAGNVYAGLSTETGLDFDTIDTAAPGVTLHSSATSLKAGEVAHLTVTLSEATTSFDLADLTVTGGSLSNFAASSGTVYTVDFTPAVDSTTNATVNVRAGAYADGAGNPSTAPDPLSMSVDTAAPAAVVSGAIHIADSGWDTGDYVTNATSQVVTGTYTGVLGSDFIEVSMDGGTSWAHAAPDTGNHSWTFTTTISGSGTIIARAADAAGNTTAAMAQAYVLDQGAPGTNMSGVTPDLAATSDLGSSNSDNITSLTTPEVHIIMSGKSGLNLHDRVVVFEQSSGIAVGSYDVLAANLIGNTWNGPDVLSVPLSLASGAHQLSVRIEDVAGNRGVGSTTALAVTIDTIAETPETPALASGSDHGDSSTDAITTTSAGGLQITGHAEPSSAVSLYDTDGVSLLGEATASSLDGSYTISLAELGEGEHYLAAAMTDKAGNTSARTDELHLTIDNTAPVVTLNIVAEDNVINLAESHTVLSGSAMGASQVTVSFGGSTHPVAPNDGTWSYTLTDDDISAMGQGPETIGVSGSDLAGNATTAESVQVTVDTTSAPAASVLSVFIDPFSDRGESDTDYITSPGETTVAGAFGGTYTGLLGDDVIQVSINNGVSWHAAIASDGHFSYSGNSLSESSTLVARVINAHGNTTAEVSHEYTFDTTAPSFVHDGGSPVDGAIDIGIDTSITFLFDEAVYVAGDGLVTLTGGSSTINVPFGPDSFNSAQKVLTVTPSALEPGVTYTATIAYGILDIAGNHFGSDSLTFTTTLPVDNEAPPPPSAPLLALSDDSADNTDGITKVAKPTFTGTAETGSTVSLYSGSSLLESVVATDGNWSITPIANLADGTHLITAKATDMAGNMSDASTAFNLKIDTILPTLVNSTVNGITGVISVHTNETSIVFGNGSIRFHDDSDDITYGADINTLTSSGDAILVPIDMLQPNRSYTVSIDSGAILDVAGNAIVFIVGQAPFTTPPTT